MGPAGLDVLALAVIEAQIVVITGDWPKDVVPYDFVRDVGIISIDERKRLAGDVANHGAMVLTKADLTRILFRRVFVRWRPVHALSRGDVKLHPLRYHVINALRRQVLNLRGVLWADDVSWFDLSGNRRRRQQREPSHSEDESD